MNLSFTQYAVNWWNKRNHGHFNDQLYDLVHAAKANATGKQKNGLKRKLNIQSTWPPQKNS